MYSNYVPYEVLKNNFMTYEEISYLKKFETTFQYIYNSKKFLESIKYLEAKFDSPYELYEYITNYFIEEKLIDIKMSYDTVVEHLLKMFGEDEVFAQVLTYDYVNSFKIIREWMYDKYDVKSEIQDYIKKDAELSEMRPVEINKKFRFIVLDYNVESKKKEKTIYKFRK